MIGANDDLAFPITLTVTAIEVLTLEKLNVKL